MPVNLKSKVSLITGAGSGIGAATAILFASNGSSLALNDINANELEITIQACLLAGLRPNQILRVSGDITNDAVAAEIVQKTIDEFGKLNILINCAGIYRKTLIADPNCISEFDKLMNINLRSYYNLISLATPYLKLTKGNIVNVSSCVSTRYFETASGYSISKAGVDQLTRALAAELGPFQIRVNSVNPGVTVTNLLSGCNFSDEFNNSWPEAHALGRTAFPDEIARPIAFLASDEASFITGTNMLVDGGLSTLLRHE